MFTRFLKSVLNFMVNRISCFLLIVSICFENAPMLNLALSLVCLYLAGIFSEAEAAGRIGTQGRREASWRAVTPLVLQGRTGPSLRERLTQTPQVSGSVGVRGSIGVLLSALEHLHCSLSPIPGSQPKPPSHPTVVRLLLYHQKPSVKKPLWTLGKYLKLCSCSWAGRTFQDRRRENTYYRTPVCRGIYYQGKELCLPKVDTTSMNNLSMAKLWWLHESEHLPNWVFIQDWWQVGVRTQTQYTETKTRLGKCERMLCLICVSDSVRSSSTFTGILTALWLLVL